MTIERIEYDPPIKVLLAELRAADAAFPKEIQKVHKALAGDIADDVRSLYEHRYTQRSGQGARSIRALATQRQAQIGIGSTRAPYTQGQNFGSHALARFAPKAEPDRFLFLTIEGMRAEIEERHGELVDDVMRRAFPERAGLS